MKSYEEVKKYVESKLSAKRFYHSLCVEERCVELAKINNVDEETARLVGIAHDVAKEMSKEEKLKFAEENNIEFNELEIKSRGLMHAKIGAKICEKEFGFSKEMIEAVASHTTGKPHMDKLAKILYIGDSTSKDRKYENMEYYRDLATEDLDKGVLEMLNKTIQICIEEGKSIHLDTVKTRNEYYCK